MTLYRAYASLLLTIAITFPLPGCGSDDCGGWDACVKKSGFGACFQKHSDKGCPVPCSTDNIGLDCEDPDGRIGRTVCKSSTDGLECAAIGKYDCSSQANYQHECVTGDGRVGRFLCNSAGTGLVCVVQ